MSEQRRLRRERERRARRAARRDQQDAATHDTLRWFGDLSAVGRGLGVFGAVYPTDPAADAEFIELIMGGVARRLRSFCPHVDVDAPRPMLASLSHGHACCRPCTPALLRTPVDDDGRCDLCDRPAHGGWFYEVATSVQTSLGAMIVLANACTDCRARLSPLPEAAAA